MARKASPALVRRANLALSTPYTAPKHELETLITKVFADVLTLDHVSIDDDFTELGGDSLLGETLSMLISERTGFDFELDSLAEHGSPRRIVELLRLKGIVAPSCPSRQAGANLGSSAQILCLRRGNQDTPLYCMPGLLGSVSGYSELAKVLGGDRPVYGIQIADQAQAFASMQEMAASIAAKLLAHRPNGPICLIGHSFGGFLAIEVARQLVGQGKLVPFVGMIDTIPGLAALSVAHRIHHFARNIGPWARPWALKVTTKEITRHWVNFCNILLRKLRGRHRMYDWAWYRNLPETHKVIVDHNLGLSGKYCFEGTYRGTIFLFRTRRSTATFDRLFRPGDDLEDYDWRRVVGANVRVVYVPGDHVECMEPPNVTTLANRLSLALGIALAATDTRRRRMSYGAPASQALNCQVHSSSTQGV
jgi:thioesterase domain-containing protein